MTSGQYVSAGEASEKLLPRVPKIVASVCLVHALLVLAPSIALAFSPFVRGVVHEMVLDFWTLFVSGLSAILAVTQYLPQIHLTFKLKHTGSLSIPTMCVQGPLHIALAVSLASRINEILDLDATSIVMFAGRVAWMNHALAGSLQFVLLVVGIYGNHIRPQLQDRGIYQQIEHSATTLPDERTPLVEGEDADELRLSHAIRKTISGCRWIDFFSRIYTFDRAGYPAIQRQRNNLLALLHPLLLRL